MFVGHEFLAFALVGWGARRVGADDSTALRLAGVAALAALLPDLDVAYAAATYVIAVVDGAPLGWEAFWVVANGVHRVVTHPLPVGVVAAFVFGAGAAIATAKTRPVPENSDLSGFLPSLGRSSLGAVIATLIAAAGTAVLLSGFRRVVGPTAALVAAAFLLVVAVAGAVVGRRTAVSSASLTAAAGVGFLTHPFGDVFLATPPPLLSPFGPPLLTERVSLATDPTVEILAVLFVELATVWLGVGVAVRLLPSDFTGSGTEPAGFEGLVDIRSALGVGYAAAVFVLPRPTVADAHVLGFTIVPLALAVGLWAGRSSDRWHGTPNSQRPFDVVHRRSGVAVGVVTGLTTLTLAAVAYLVLYLFVS